MATPIFYINMASRPDRRAFMETQLAALGLAGQRIEAVTPAALSDTQLRRCANRGLSPGVLCCTLSHLEALAAVEATKAPHALILEDDAVLSSQLPAFLIAFARAPVAGIVRIETSRNGVRYRRIASRAGAIDLVVPTNFEGGSAAYLISAAGASAVRARINLDVGFDEALFNPFGYLKGRVPLYQATPALVIQSHLLHTPERPRFKSDINAVRPPRPRGIAALPHRLREFYRRDLVYGAQRTLQQWLGARKHIIPFAE